MPDEYLIFLGITIGVIEVVFITLISLFVWKKRKEVNITYRKILR